MLEKEYGIDDIKLYAYFEDKSSLYIVGEIIALAPQKPFCMICTLYDKDGDVLETTESSSYGSGLALQV